MSVPFREDAIARGNRQRENLLRLSGFAACLAQPRWCLSLSGAGLVLAVLGYFQIAVRPPNFDGLAALAAGLIIVLLTRDGRAALAGVMSSGLLLLFTGGVGEALLLFLFFALVLVRSAAAWRGAGEATAMAWARTIEDHGATLLFAGVAAAIAASLDGGVPAGRYAGFAVIAALLLFPAFTGALYDLFPPRRSVEDIYGSSAS